MKFAHMMLLSTASAFTITIDQGKLEDIAGNWQSSAEDFMRWSEEQDQATLEAAQPYLDQMDAALQELLEALDVLDLHAEQVFLVDHQHVGSAFSVSPDCEAAPNQQVFLEYLLDCF